MSYTDYPLAGNWSKSGLTPTVTLPCPLNRLQCGLLHFVGHVEVYNFAGDRNSNRSAVEELYRLPVSGILVFGGFWCFFAFFSIMSVGNPKQAQCQIVKSMELYNFAEDRNSIRSAVLELYRLPVSGKFKMPRFSTILNISLERLLRLRSFRKHSRSLSPRESS